MKVSPKVKRRASVDKRSHAWLDTRSLEMARLIVAKIKRDPALLAVPRNNLRRWKKSLKPWPACLQEWEEILDRNPTHRVLAIFTKRSEEGNRLRQSSPFAGILTEAERMKILLAYEAD